VFVATVFARQVGYDYLHRPQQSSCAPLGFDHVRSLQQLLCVPGGSSQSWLLQQFSRLTIRIGCDSPQVHQLAMSICVCSNSPCAHQAARANLRWLQQFSGSIIFRMHWQLSRSFVRALGDRPAHLRGSWAISQLIIRAVGNCPDLGLSPCARRSVLTICVCYSSVRAPGVSDEVTVTATVLVCTAWV
jgi:hypothetical protein